MNPSRFLGSQVLTVVTRTDAILFRFLERYLGQLEGPVANQVWNQFMQLVREVVTGLKDLKLQGYYILRFALKTHSMSVRAHRTVDA